MKNTLKFNLLLATLLFAAFAKPVAAQDLAQEIDALGTSYMMAFNKGDAEELSALYAKEIVFVNAKDGSTSTATREQIKASFVKDFSKPAGSINIKGTGFEVLPDGKVKITGTFSILSGSDANPADMSYENLLVKEDGQWKLCQLKSLVVLAWRRVYRAHFFTAETCCPQKVSPRPQRRRGKITPPRRCGAGSAAPNSMRAAPALQTPRH
ncbi:MAG: nuclear transport factor 2 family protein [Lewinellaceae bacterium]|nr:nuclear transport factor 2 family protein [Lewinellaceae bacterium]